MVFVAPVIVQPCETYLIKRMHRMNSKAMLTFTTEQEK